jgi:hypothetical protein
MVAFFRPVLPHWGLIGLVSLFPLLGRDWSARFVRRPLITRNLIAACAGISLVVVVLAIVQFRYGWFQRGDHGRGGLVDAASDPTADLYGWDEVTSRIKRLGLIDEPHTFVFTHYWYQSAQLAFALGRQRPVLCYNADDPRGFAFWSRPDEWVGRDGILVLVGEPGAQPRYFERWFTHVEPVADFWVQRSGKPIRRIGLYRCVRQRAAFPFALIRNEQIARKRGARDLIQQRALY